MKISAGGKPVGAAGDARAAGRSSVTGVRRRVVHLDQRRERRRQHAVLEEVALPGERVVEHAPRRAHARLARRRSDPTPAPSRGAKLFLSVGSAARHARVAGIDEPGRRGRETRRLLAGVERVEGVVDVDERRAAARSGAPRFSVRCGDDPELVLHVAGVEPAVAVLRSPAWSSPELCRQPEQEVGGARCRWTRAAESEVAVRAG